MLEALRRGAQSWVAKLLFAVLIVSFGVFWNVADVFRGFGRGSIAHVGKTEITAPQFQRAFQDEIQALSSQSGQRITSEQALMMRLDKQALERLIAQTAVKAHANDLKLALSDEELVEGMKRDPIFAGPDGKFSRVKFDTIARGLGVSEQGLIALRREDEVRRQILEALRVSIAVPPTAIEALNAYRNEKRTIEYFTVDAAKAVTVAEPDEAKLRETYEANKGRFMTPEYRQVAVLLLSVDDLKKDVALTDEELKTAYTDTKDTYDKPERRRVQQIAFKDRAAADAARKALVDDKKNFLDVAKDAGAKESDVNLGMLTKKQMIDPAIADAAFSLKRDEISPVIDGRFAPVIVRVIEIDEGKESTFDEVKDQVRDALAKAKAQELIQDRYDLVEEGRNAGKTLKEIGDEQKLRYIDVSTDKANKTPDGKTAIEDAGASDLLQTVFETQPGSDHEAVELPNNTYAWFDILGTTESKQKPFDEVKDDVKTLYMENEKQRLLSEFASKLVERLKAGEALDKVAEDAGGKPETTEPITRAVLPLGMTGPAMREAFSLPQGGAGSAPTIDNTSRVVFRVKEITPAPQASKEQAEALASEIRGDLANEMLIAYVSALRDELGVTVNEKELDRITGADTGTTN